MAFIDQVQDLTSLTLTGDTDELSHFLKDGVIDVTSRWLAIKPQDVELFGRETTISDSQGVSVGGAKIISVIREAIADGSSDGSTAWEPCRKIPSSMQSRVVDVDSLSYASPYNPVYTINSDKTINVYPIPSSNNGFKVFYVNEEPRDISNNAALIHSHSNIKYFPNDKVYLVVMYAGIRSLHAALATKSAPSVPVSQVLPALNITVTDPTAISLTTVNYNPVIASTSTAVASLTAPTYSKPTLVLSSAPTISNLSINAVPPDVPTQDTSLPVYEEADATAWSDGSIEEEISKLQDYIEDEEDVELANAKVAEINTRFQRASEEFNNKIKQWQTENSGELQRYQNEVQAYQTEVNSQVQEYQQNLAGDLQVWQAERQTDLQKYGTDVQNELNEFNKENASFSYEVQKALSDAQATNQVALQNGSQEAKDAIENNNAQVQRFQSMAQHYSTQVNEDIQKYTVQVQALTADIQASVAEHGAELQGTQVEYQWLQDQYTRLKAEYDQAFMIATPKQQAAPQAARQRR